MWLRSANPDRDNRFSELDDLKDACDVCFSHSGSLLTIAHRDKIHVSVYVSSLFVEHLVTPSVLFSQGDLGLPNSDSPT